MYTLYLGYLKMTKLMTVSENKIAQEFFKEYTNVTTVSKKLYETKSKTLGIVSHPFGMWRKKEYFYEENLLFTKIHQKGENKGKEYVQRGPQFIFNLNILFDYLSEKKIELSQAEKNYLDLIFSHTHIRKAVCELFEKEDLREAIIKFYLNFLVFPSVLKDGYIKQKDEIKHDKEFFNNMDEFLSKHSKFKRDIIKAKRNPNKISSTKTITAICKNSLKEVIDPKIITPVEYARILLRPSYLVKQENLLEGKFIKKLNIKMMKGYGIDTI